MENWEIRPPLPQKPLNRSSPKFAWVITSGTPAPMQNFITIQLPPFAPIYAKMRIKWLDFLHGWFFAFVIFLVLPSDYSQDPCTDFHDRKVKWRGFAQGCAFWGSRKQNFTFRPHFPPKTQIFRQFSTGRRKFRVKQALTMRCSPYTTLNRHRSPIKVV